MTLRGETSVGANARIFSFASIGSQRHPSHKIAIGARTSIREHVSITADKADEPTTIGEGALIMSGCEIGSGTTIGNGVVIGSNSRIEVLSYCCVCDLTLQMTVGRPHRRRCDHRRSVPPQGWRKNRYAATL